jgi:N-acetylmuramic acid 6-phosphate (MurNAc-6-P) etherase
MEVCDVDRAAARKLIDASGGLVKTAIVMHFLNASRADAERALAEGGGVIRRVLDRPPPPVPA